jgi:3-dehydroquinate synthase
MPNNEIFMEISQDRKYPIFVDTDRIEKIGDRLFEYTDANKILIVVSEKVNKIYGEELNFKNSVKFVLKDGENQKNFKNYQKIINFASKNKLERKDAIVAIGGGVVGDIAGFAASTYLRGIDFIQVPTTLLACVDSSVGGKVAINTDFGKNLVGTFYQPKAVFCNLNFLHTLDERQYKTGLAEVIKYAYIEKSCGAAKEYDFFEFLSANPQAVYERNLPVLSEIVKASLNLKIAVVSKDEKEQGLRKILNFGHTYGHALEKLTNYQKYTHGEAVAFGMKFSIILAFKRDLISEDYKDRALALLDKYSLVEKRPKISPKKIIELMKQDKKVENGKINFILPFSKSHVACYDDITSEEIKAALLF